MLLRDSCRWLAVVIVLGLGSGATAQSAASMPDTPSGKCAAAWFEMLRDGSETAVRAFETAWASPKRLARTPMAERLAGVATLREDLGAVSIKEVMFSDADEIVVLVERPARPALTLEFAFDPEAPGRLDVIRISGGVNRPVPMTPERRAATVAAVARILEAQYVFPEIAAKMAAAVRGKLAAGKYDALRSESAFAQRVLGDLREVSPDLHLRLWVEPEAGITPPVARRRSGGPRSENMMFRKVEVFEGNVGYVRFDAFFEGSEPEETAAAALAFVKHADALIFDLRWNGGGSPAMIRFITSFLFDAPTHLNDMVDRNGATVEEYWTLDQIPGRRFEAGLPVYVLTSGRTFSGAEEFAYNLKALKRATIVGERTGGGAHPTSVERVDDRFVMSVPFMRAHNPITKTNWEGKGVEPDIAVAADAALERALAEARRAADSRREAPAQQAAPESRPFPLMVGDAAPALRVNRFVKGSPIAAFQPGHAYLIEFWATWCGPCKDGIPHLTSVQKKHAGKLTVVGISVWEPRDKDVDPFVKEWDERMQYTVAVDEVVGVDSDDEEQRSRQSVQKGLMSKAYLVDSGASDGGIPQAFIVDQNGRLAWMGDPTEADEPLEQVLAGKYDLAAAAARHRTQMELEVLARGQRTKARAARKAGDLKGALEHVDAILARGESLADVVFKFKLLVELEQHAAAAALYEASRSKLKWHQATNMMGMLAHDGRRLTPEIARLGIAACEAALRTLGKDHTWPLMTLAQLEHRLGRKAEALAAADRALAIAKDSEKPELLAERKKFEAGGGSLKDP